MELDQKFITDFSYSTGQRGCQQLVYESYTYVKNSVNRQRTIWKCSRKVSVVTCLYIDLNEIKLISISNFQGSRKCRAKIITDVINGQVTIVNVKGTHNHPVNIKRNKPIHQLSRRHTRTLHSSQELRICKVDGSEVDQFEYQDYIVEEDDDSINI